MKNHLLAVYDRITKQYDRPFTSRGTERIQEEFDLICADPKTSYSRKPDEYEVHELGIFNDSPHHDPDIQNTFYPNPRVVAQGRLQQQQGTPNANS